MEPFAIAFVLLAGHHLGDLILYLLEAIFPFAYTAAMGEDYTSGAVLIYSRTWPRKLNAPRRIKFTLT